jgi:hypothetical protein
VLMQEIDEHDIHLREVKHQRVLESAREISQGVLKSVKELKTTLGEKAIKLTQKISRRKSNVSFNYHSKMTEHCLHIEDLLKNLGTTANLQAPASSFGLSNIKFEENMINFGPNTVFRPKRKPKFYKFTETLTNLFNIILFAAGAMYLVLYAINPEKNWETVSVVK